jgi:hypothetical protein
MFHPGLDDLLVDIDSVCQHPANYNNGDLDAITASIETNGMYRPLYVQASTGQILAGNHTWAACKALGATLVPVVTLDVDDHTAKRIMLADNRTAALAEPDNALLLSLLKELADHDSLLGTGYTEYDLVALEALAEVPLTYEDFAQWELFSVRLPPQTLAGFRTMTEAAVGDRERFELLMRLAGWKPNKKERQ